jgi:hypothetical protein
VGGSASVGHPRVWGQVGDEEDHVGPGGVAGGRMWVEVAAFQNFCEVSDTTGAGREKPDCDTKQYVHRLGRYVRWLTDEYTW